MNVFNLSLSCPGWQRNSREERSKGPEGRTRPSWSGPALSCGMPPPHTCTHKGSVTVLIYFPLALRTHLISVTPFLCFSEFLLQCCKCVTGSCWQGCDESKELSVKAGLSSPATPPLPPSGPEGPCSVVQYLCFFSLLLSDHYCWCIYCSRSLFNYFILGLWAEGGGASYHNATLGTAQSFPSVSKSRLHGQVHFIHLKSQIKRCDPILCTSTVTDRPSCHLQSSVNGIKSQRQSIYLSSVITDIKSHHWTFSFFPLLFPPYRDVMGYPYQAAGTRWVLRRATCFLFCFFVIISLTNEVICKWF